jgi:GlpG protein
MRLIAEGSFDQINHFSAFLNQEGINNEVEQVMNNDGALRVKLWIIVEDDVSKAMTLWKEFEENSEDSKFKSVNISPPSSFNITKPIIPPNARIASLKKRGKTPIIILLIALSILVYMVGEWTQKPVSKNIQDLQVPMVLAPNIMKDFLFDWPAHYEIAEKIFTLYPPTEISNKTAPSQGLIELERQLNNTPFFKGYYDIFIERFKNESVPLYEGSYMFEKIKQGQYWRLFTPVLLHGNLLHILFNVMWIVILGFQIERKIGSTKTLLFILITGIFSNICQYLMSGPNFLGLSGIVIAMAGFIWAREKKAPWEGYLLHSSTMLFITIYVLAMFGVQLVSFFFELYGNTSFTPGIANTAHISGGIIGLLLGTLKFFERKPQKIKKNYFQNSSD